MDRLALVATKGGVGKTTLAVHIAVAAQLEGLPVLILDIDPQGSAAQWFKDRQRTFRDNGWEPRARLDVRRIYPDELTDVLDEAERDGFALAVIDAPPHADYPAARAAEVADLVLMPSGPSSLDLHASRATINLVRDLRKKAYFIINRALHNSPQTAIDAASYLAGKGIAGAPITITSLQPYVRAFRDGLTAPEMAEEGRPFLEIGTLWGWLSSELAEQRRLRAARPALPKHTATLLEEDPFDALFDTRETAA